MPLINKLKNRELTSREKKLESVSLTTPTTSRTRTARMKSNASALKLTKTSKMNSKAKQVRDATKIPCWSKLKSKKQTR